jgi:hypothetical protein
VAPEAGVKKSLVLPRTVSAEEARTLQAACGEEEESREAVRALLARKPEIARQVSTADEDAERGLSASPQVLVQEIVRVQQQELRESLIEPGDGPLERLVIERIALLKLAVLRAEEGRAHSLGKGLELSHAEHLDRRLSRLNADLLRACGTLARVRRLRIGGIQVNIAEQQVNVSG